MKAEEVETVGDMAVLLVADWMMIQENQTKEEKEAWLERFLTIGEQTHAMLRSLGDGH